MKVVMNKSLESKEGQQGFTLVELLIVLAILGLLAGIAVPQLMGSLERAQVDTTRVQIEKLESIIDLYRLEVGRYPDSEEGLHSLVSAPAGVSGWTGPYLKNEKALMDPWGSAFVYQYPGENGEYDLYSLGADGKAGGEGNDADITNW